MREHLLVETVGVHHVSLGTPDVASTTAFYCDVLGGTLLDRPDFGFPGAWIALGSGQVHLIPSDDAPSGANHVALQVTDRDAAVAELRSRGVEVTVVEPHVVGAGRQAFLSDPAGNLVELNEPD